MDLPQHDELHVVSDLHIGGAPDFQVMNRGGRLAGFIRWVAAQRPEGRVALVLNGDVIDSLAEDISGYVAVHDAVPMLHRMFKYDAFRVVWDALAHFVKQPNRTLVIVIGNHDIELAFPPVQHAIVSRLTGDDLAARARIEFSTMGAGYSCHIGTARIFCTHGNEVDAWNFVRYEDLSKAARRLNAARPLDPGEWEPNAGTRMVMDVMNDVKRKYAWIDLLKPEERAAVGVLLVLDPSQISRVNRLLPAVGTKLRTGGQVNQRLSAEGFATPAREEALAARVDQLLGPNLASGLEGGARAGGTDGDAMLLEAEKTFTDRTAQPLPAGTLGTGQLVWDRLTGWIRGVGRDEALRRALKDWLKDDRTFSHDVEDDTFKAVTASVGAEVDFVVTGHTHLERAIDMGGGRGYFNTGTWIRLLRITDEMLENTKSFAPVYEVLMNGSMKAIDAASIGGRPFVLDRTSAVSIRTTNDGALGTLVHVLGDGTRQKEVAALRAR
jgi:UDP-2,3-diacylglucosamine pyrophosphatase LpxH